MKELFITLPFNRWLSAAESSYEFEMYDGVDHFTTVDLTYCSTVASTFVGAHRGTTT
jgi:hypothetical protein